MSFEAYKQGRLRESRKTLALYLGIFAVVCVASWALGRLFG